MNNTPEDLNYLLRCKSCDNDFYFPHLLCRNCGLVDGIIKSNEAGLNPRAICQKCQHTLPLPKTPEVCPHCNSPELHWYNPALNEWQQPELDVASDIAENAVWISGDFDGNYLGDSTSVDSITPADNIRLYGLRIQGGALKNISKVDRPPLSLDSNEPWPIRQNIVNTQLENLNYSETVSTDLYDFRLHNPNKIAYKELLSKQQLNGRITGKAYAYIPPLINKTIANKSVIPAIDKVSSSDSSQPSLPTLDTTDATICPSCWLTLHLILTAILWIACGWKLALAGFGVMTVTCAVDKQLDSNGQKIHQQKLRLYFAIALLALSVGGIVLFNYLLNKAGCINAPLWPLLLPAIALLLGAWLYNCVVKFILLILYFIALLCWCGMRLGGCELNNDGFNLPIASSISQLQQSAKNILENHDNSTNTVSQATKEQADNQLISIDDAINNPNLVDNCNNSIYFPQASMFDLDQDIIKTSAEAGLRKLLDLMKEYPDRHLIVTGHTDSTGDDTPEGVVHNIDLSERRAMAVANWLTENGKINSEQIEVRGAGSKFPLTGMTDQFELNRRVEVKVGCNRKE